MWCTKCNIETNENICPVCGSKTIDDLPTGIYWCKFCHVPVIQTAKQTDNGTCPVCGRPTKYLATDLRPVFPEERLLLEILLEMDQDALLSKSVWANNNRYYIDGKVISLPNTIFQEADTEQISEEINKRRDGISYTHFDANMKTFILVNQTRLNFLKDEAFSFIQEAASKLPEEKIVVSF